MKLQHLKTSSSQVRPHFVDRRHLWGVASEYGNILEQILTWELAAWKNLKIFKDEFPHEFMDNITVGFHGSLAFRKTG